MHVQPYLNFSGRCEEALEFYKKAVGANVGTLMRFSDSPEPLPPDMVPPGSENKVMHSDFSVGETQLLASDGGCMGEADFGGISLALEAADVAGAERLFKALGEGGKVKMPMTKTFFSPAFGEVVDQFGVTWLVMAPEGSN